jgi:glutaconyl-CoA/methylmalonyl-CoA decarboxylase subunit gamma
VNDTLVVIEAMKMNSNVSSPIAGTIRSISVKVGDSVRQGVPLLEFN